MDYKKLKKYIIPALAVFVAITIFNIIFHGTLMGDLYLENSQLFRSQDEIQKGKAIMWLADLIYSFAFCYIYSKGHEKDKKGLTMQGIRFGLWITLLMLVPTTLVEYTVFPYPKTLELAWLGGYTVKTLLAGITVANVYPKIK